MTHEEFMKIVREKNEWHSHPERWTEVEKIREQIITSGKSKDECLELREEVRRFLKSDASEEDKKMLLGYTELLQMACSTVEQDILK